MALVASFHLREEGVKVIAIAPTIQPSRTEDKYRRARLSVRVRVRSVSVV